MKENNGILELTPEQIKEVKERFESLTENTENTEYVTIIDWFDDSIQTVKK